MMETDFHLPINIGNPYEKTVMEIAHLIKELTGSKSEIVMKPLPTDDPKRRLPNIGRAKELLDWTPQVELNDGLTRTIEWFESQLKEKQAAG